MTDGEIAKKVSELFDMRPYFIEQRLKLRNPIYSETAAYGHMGRTAGNRDERISFARRQDGNQRSGIVYLGKTGLRK